MKSATLCALALLAVAAVGVNGAAEQVTFCQRYTQALFGSISSANEVSLISAVVDRALSGNTTSTAGNLNVRGILNSPLQMPFFTAPVNFYTNANLRNTLVAHLKSFFTVAFGCKEVASPGTFNGNMRTVHAGMAINATVWNDFLGELVTTLRSFGVGDADITYAAALLGQFAMATSGDNTICNQADCPVATSYGAFIAATNSASAFVWMDASGTDEADSTVNISPNGNVHWDMGLTHSVVQTDASFAVMAGGFTSGAVGATNSYTRVFPTAGTYYFKCGNANHVQMRGTVVVGQSSAAYSTASASLVLQIAAVITAVIASKRM